MTSTKNMIINKAAKSDRVGLILLYVAMFGYDRYMSHLTKASKIKLLMLIMYFIVCLVFFGFVLSSAQIQAHHVIGIVVTVIAFFLWIIARIQLGNSFTIAPEAKELVTTGFYSKLRHPVYYFSILAVAGLAIFIWNPFALLILVALLGLEIVRFREEEKILQEKFGKKYQEYKKQTWL